MYPQCIQIDKKFVFVENRDIARYLQKKLEDLYLCAKMMDYEIKCSCYDELFGRDDQFVYEILFSGRKEIQVDLLEDINIGLNGVRVFEFLKQTSKVHYFKEFENSNELKEKCVIAFNIAKKLI
ncbi:hypothetical protein D3C87_78430 [compost metagenome]